jgi:hypothetical protein
MHLDNSPFIDKLSSHHWDSLLWLMRCAEECFKTIADHKVIRHLIVVYFCFPTLGVAVPQHPGDYLMFNALIPHCISLIANLTTR